MSAIIDKPFTLAGRTYESRLLVGTGKYKDLEETRLAIEASGAEIVTVAVRRTNIGQNPGEPNLLDVIDPQRYTILPNTAGCYDAAEAVRTCRLARELLDGHKLVKLEVLADQKTLFPNVIETLKAAEVLVKDGFDVMVYTSDDPIIARQLAEMGCIAVMPLAGLIGTGLGICNPYNRRGYRLRRHHRHGAGLRGGADEQRHRPCAEPGADGRGDEARDHRRAHGLPGRTHAEETLCQRLVAAGWPDQVREPDE
jgi:thiazole synthase